MKFLNVITVAGRPLTRAAALLAVGLMPGAANAQISVDELELFLRPEMQEQRAGVIRVTNHADKATQVMIEIEDWDRDSTGANRFYDLGTLKQSCRDRLRVFPTSLRIEANATEAVRISFEGDKTDSCWGIVFLQTTDVPKPGSGVQVTYVIRTGVKVYVEPRGLLKQGDVDSVEMTTAPASETDTTQVPALAVVFRNSGQSHLRAKGSVELRDENNNVAANLEIPEFPITPGGVRHVVLKLPQLKAGRYVALALVDYDGPEIAAGQYAFEVP